MLFFLAFLFPFLSFASSDLELHERLDHVLRGKISLLNDAACRERNESSAYSPIYIYTSGRLDAYYDILHYLHCPFDPHDLNELDNVRNNP